LLVALQVAIYVSGNLSTNERGVPVMPLDDAYIHFQYARTIAEGYPYRFNPDQPPTSGATSLLYPFLLAVGYWIGFQGELLGWWAFGLGALSWLGATGWLYDALSHLSRSRGIALIMSASFALTGSLAWAFMSGMETGLLVGALMLTLSLTVRGRWRGAVLAAAVTALIRPEGLLLGGLTVAYVALASGEGQPHRLRYLLVRFPLYALPICAGALQPLLNWALTGSFSATGLQAKSYFYNVPPDLAAALGETLETFGWAWLHLLWDTSRPFIRGESLPLTAHSFLLLPLAAVALVIGLRQSLRDRKVALPLLLVGWMVSVIGTASVLETAFWHMGRYQQPAVALLYPLATVAVIALITPAQRTGAPAQSAQRRRKLAAVRTVVFSRGLTLVLIHALAGAWQFYGYYVSNVREVASSQRPMAAYVSRTLPPTAIIGVHDIGVMRYVGGRTTYDVVGLTTPGAATAWRSGPGTTYEQMAASKLRPDYFAIYPDARGLTYLADTSLFGEEIAAFPSVVAAWYNVASATWTGQRVYRADWTPAASADQPQQPYSLAAITGLMLVDRLNVAALADEAAHDYAWSAAARPGFVSEVRQMPYIHCQPRPDDPRCETLDGGRVLREEAFTISTQPGQDLLWIVRVHPFEAADLELRVNGERVGVRHVPAQPGEWLEIASLIPGATIRDQRTRLQITVKDGAAAYLPFYHWFYQGTFAPDTHSVNAAAPAIFAGAITLKGRALAYDPGTRTLTLTLDWEAGGGVEGMDAKLFVHLYAPDGTLIELPGAQFDGRLGGGTLPPANLLLGTLREVVTLYLDAVPAGTYRVAVGLYRPTGTLERYAVTGDGADSERRLFVGEVVVAPPISP
jgi:hypothetical protein